MSGSGRWGAKKPRKTQYFRASAPSRGSPARLLALLGPLGSSQGPLGALVGPQEAPKRLLGSFLQPLGPEKRLQGQFFRNSSFSPRGVVRFSYILNDSGRALVRPEEALEAPRERHFVRKNIGFSAMEAIDRPLLQEPIFSNFHKF